METQTHFIIFHLGDKLLAIHLESVEKIIPMVNILRPAGLPWVLEGLVNCAGEFIPLVKSEQVLGLEDCKHDLYSQILLLRMGGRKLGMIVNKVIDIIEFTPGKGQIFRVDNSLHNIIESEILYQQNYYSLLNLDKLLLAKEMLAISEFETKIRERLLNLDGTKV